MIAKDSTCDGFVAPGTRLAGLNPWDTEDDGRKVTVTGKGASC
jgi:hypothetical protein